MTDVERLFRTYNAALVRYLTRRLGDRDWAEEVAQETFVRALRQTSIQNERAWLFAVANESRAGRGEEGHETSKASRVAGGRRARANGRAGGDDDRARAGSGDGAQGSRMRSPSGTGSRC